jgi:hypothetical protein
MRSLFKGILRSLSRYSITAASQRRRACRPEGSFPAKARWHSKPLGPPVSLFLDPPEHAHTHLLCALPGDGGLLRRTLTLQGVDECLRSPF